jgi:hypothetical protein
MNWLVESMTGERMMDPAEPATVMEAGTVGVKLLAPTV